MEQKMKYDTNQLDKKSVIIIFMISLGIAIRFGVMSFGHNFDFSSYCIIGKMASQLKNVYAEIVEIGRYNYGPLFMIIQGICYKLSKMSDLQLNTYRVLIVTVLTFADIGIMMWISMRYNIKKGLIFFLNPISIIITGYHNQFDNIAVLLMLLACQYYNEEAEIKKNDWMFVILFSASLMMKHIMCFMCLWLLFNKLTLKKKLFYAIFPACIFFLSFIPFILQDRMALDSVIKHVFLYRSYNNAPLLGWIYRIIHFPEQLWIFSYILMLGVLGFICRKIDFSKQVLLYLIAMVAFSSAIANQYLVIPVAAICILCEGKLKYVYYTVIGFLLMLEHNGLHMLNTLRAFTRGGVEEFILF